MPFTYESLFFKSDRLLAAAREPVYFIVMNDTLNFYEILELDPSVSVDRQKGQIETTINTKKREWSRERRPGKRARAELARSSVQRMLDTLNSDPDLWRRHARERLKQINAKEAEAQKLYRDFRDVYGKKSISEDLLTNLDMLSGEKRDARAILSSLGVSVVSPNVQEKTEVPSTGLPKHTRRNLERFLKILGFEDLYLFLSAGAETTYDERSSPEALLERCKAILEEVRKGRKTAEATNRQELAGLGLPLFKDAESKSKYDTSRSLESLIRYESLTTIFKNIGYIEPDQLDTLVGKAVRDSGASESTVRGCFKQMLEHHEVKTIEGATERSHVSICPYCGHFNKETAKTCSKCSNSIIQNCFNCGTDYAAELSICPACRTTGSSCLEAQAALADARLYLSAGELDKATEALSRASSLAPKSQAVAAIAEKLGREIKEVGIRVQEIEALIASKRLRAAEATIGKAGRIIGPDKQRTLIERVRRDLDAVAKLIEQAERASMRRDPEAAYQLLTRAQHLIADDPALERVLSHIVPPPPEEAKRTCDRSAVLLEWKPARCSIPGIEYIVVRNVGGAPLTSTDGQIVFEGKATSFRDTGCPIGVPVHYGVFSKVGSGIGDKPALAGSVFRTAPVRNLQVTPRENSIELKWDLPPHGTDAAIYRMPLGSPPSSISGWRPIAFARTSWLDENPDRRRESTYMVMARFRLPNTRNPVTSDPVSTDAGVVVRPSRPQTIKKKAGESAQILRLTWTPPKDSAEVDEVLIYDSGLSMSEKEIYLESSLPGPLARIPVVVAGTHPLKLDFFGTVWVVVARRRGAVLSCSKSTKVVSRPALGGLSVLQTGEGNAQVSWRWPDGCSRAELRVTVKGKAEKHVVSRASSESGEFTLSLDPEAKDLTVTAYAISADGQERSVPVSCTISVHRLVKMTYWTDQSVPFLRKKWRTSVSSRLQLHVRLNPPAPFPGIVVRYHPNQIPGSDLAVAAPNTEVILQLPPSGEIEAEKVIDLSEAIGGRRGYLGIALADLKDKTVFKQIIPLHGMNGVKTH